MVRVGRQIREHIARMAEVTIALFGELGVEGVEFRMDHDGAMLKATVPSVFPPEIGRPLWLTIQRDRCFVFPRTRKGGVL